MPRAKFEQLLEAGCHFGHLKRKWNPGMAPYIFTEKKGIHIIDLHKTVVKLDEACSALKQIAKSGKKVIFVATKKQAKELVAERVGAVNMPFVTERWSGGMLTNFATIRKSVKKMNRIEKMKTDGTFEAMSKRERLFKTRQQAKLEKNLGSIADLTRIPAAVFVVDVSKEDIAVAEAVKLGIPVFAIIDTNSDPSNVDFPIPANDDASKSIATIMDVVCEAIKEGLSERKTDRDAEEKNEAKAAAPKAPRARKADKAEKAEKVEKAEVAEPKAAEAAPEAEAATEATPDADKGAEA